MVSRSTIWNNSCCIVCSSLALALYPSPRWDFVTVLFWRRTNAENTMKLAGETFFSPLFRGFFLLLFATLAARTSIVVQINPAKDKHWALCRESVTMQTLNVQLIVSLNRLIAYRKIVRIPSACESETCAWELIRYSSRRPELCFRWNLIAVYVKSVWLVPLWPQKSFTCDVDAFHTFFPLANQVFCVFFVLSTPRVAIFAPSCLFSHSNWLEIVKCA